MSFGLGMYLRDTSLKFRQQSMDLTRASLGSFKTSQINNSGVYSSNSMSGNNPWQMNIGNENENLNWLL
jgi:hypothetical protein